MLKTKRTIEGPTELRGDGVTYDGMHGGAGMVGGVLGDSKWLFLYFTETGPDNHVRCFEERLRSGQYHTGRLITGRSEVSHKTSWS